ncbi:TPA: hypothetical protein TXJ10_002081 [Streptococcus suis]|nr:hypothetical protein [Streptococcus suis]HEL1599805.1 hypothetical protein [Streptococcus suis]
MCQNIPYLTGGILFSLLLHARKTRQKARDKLNGGSDHLRETDLMNEINYVLTGNDDFPAGDTLKRATSQYKKCEKSQSSYIELDNPSNLRIFCNIKNNPEIYFRISRLIDKFLGNDKRTWLAQALLETIESDTNIPNDYKFNIDVDIEVTKDTLNTVAKVNLPMLIYSMLCFILSHRINNSLGEPTFKKWHSKGSRNAWIFQHNDLGSKFSSLTNVVTPSTEEIDDFFKNENQNPKIPYPTTSCEENHPPSETSEENNPIFPSHQIANNIVNVGNGGIVNLTKEPTFQMENGKPIVPITPSQFNKNNNTITLNGISVQIPIQILSNVPITSEDAKHIKALYEIYTEKTGKTIDCNNIDQLPKHLKKHLTAQNRSYFALEEKQRAIRDVFSDGDYQFEVLKDDAFNGIEMTYLNDYSSGYERLNAVLEKITTITLDNSSLKNIIGLIGNLEKRGICHILVNDEIINSWVNIND